MLGTCALSSFPIHFLHISFPSSVGSCAVSMEKILKKRSPARPALHLPVGPALVLGWAWRRIGAGYIRHPTGCSLEFTGSAGVFVAGQTGGSPYAQLASRAPDRCRIYPAPYRLLSGFRQLDRRCACRSDRRRTSASPSGRDFLHDVFSSNLKQLRRLDRRLRCRSDRRTRFLPKRLVLPPHINRPYPFGIRSTIHFQIRSKHPHSCSCLLLLSPTQNPHFCERFKSSLCERS